MPVMYTPIPTAKGAKEPKLQLYLQSIEWDARQYTNAQLESMLAASCLRFLGGLTDIYFVLGLAKEIQGKYKRTMNLSLWYSIEILTDLADNLSNHTIHPTDADTINEYIDDAQEIITKRKYLSAFTG